MKDRIIIENAAIVTMNDDDDVFFAGSMVIEGNRIVSVGGSEAARGFDRKNAKVIDAGGKAALPGFVDLHYHTAIGKGYCDHLDLWEILQAFWYPMIRAINPEEAYWAAMASYSESLKAGVTTANDMFRQLPALARAAVDSGIRVVLSNDIADPEHDLDVIEDNESAYHECHGMGNGAGGGLRGHRVATPRFRAAAGGLPGAGGPVGDRNPHPSERIPR